MRRLAGYAMLALAVGCGSDGGTEPQAETVSTLQLDVTSATLVPNEEVNVAATARSAAGTVVADAVLTWASDDMAVATVTNGLIRGVAAGTATITVTSGSVRAEVPVQVDRGGFVGPAGGTVSAFGGAVTLAVPPGALSAGTAIRITAIPAPIADPIFVRASGGGVAFNGTFAVPARLSLSYNEADRPTGLPEARLGIGQLNTGEWSHVAGSSADVAANRASADITGPGNFGVIMAPSSTPCAGAQHHEFDFRIGTFTWAGPGTLRGDAVITAEPSGCSLREDLRIANGNRVRAVFFYDPATAMWHYTSTDGGVVTYLSGARDGDRMILYNPARTNRVVWEQVSAAAHLQAGEASPNGSTWNRLAAGTYTRQ